MVNCGEDWPGLVNYFLMVNCLGKLTLIIYLRILGANSYLAATMMWKSVTFLRNFIMSFFSGGQILESYFQQSLLCLNT